MAVAETLVGALAGGSFAVLGGWLGARWQAGEARRVRQEQYAREDNLRLLAERRELYSRFALAADPDIDSEDQESKLMELDRLAWEIKLVGSPEVADSARSLVDALDASDYDLSVHWETYTHFVTAFRHELFPGATAPRSLPGIEPRDKRADP